MDDDMPPITDLEDSDEPVTVELPSNLLAQIDAQVGSAFTDRDDFIRTAVRYYIEHMRDTQSADMQDIG